MPLPRAYLIDSSIYIFRAWFVYDDSITDSKGNPSNAVFGFSDFLYQLIRQKKPEFIACAFDSSQTDSYRKGLYPEYKANRDPAPEELKVQFQHCRDFCHAVGIPHFGSDRFEADDIIGTLVENTQEFGQHDDVMIISADKDFIQLQKYNNVRQFSPMTKKFIQDPNPRRYLFDQILKGDSSDGVPNIFSPDNTFVDGIRQSPMTKKKMDMYFENAENLQGVMETEHYRNYCRNKKMIDLSETPQDLKDAIINRFDNQKVTHKSKVLNYLIKKHCKLLIESVEEFT